MPKGSALPIRPRHAYRVVRWACAAALLAAGGGCEAEDPAPDDAGVTIQADGAGDPQWPWLTVIDTMGFTRQKPIGVAPGFDLDGKISDTDDASTCGKGDLRSPDGEQGIDNEFAKLVPLVEASGIGALEGLIQSTINDGGIMLMLQLDGLDDPVDDAEVTLRVRAGAGVPLLGTDGLLLAGQTFSKHTDSPEVATAATVQGGVMNAGPFDLKLPLVVFGVRYDLDLRSVRVRARLTASGGMAEGIFGGGLTMASILDIAQKGAADQKNLVELVMGVLGGAGDLAPDPETGECTQLSAVLQFTGVNAYLFDDTTQKTAP
ncbi:MAG: hypothetical protein RIT45_2143 [Pseudomonadota bacterium]